MNEGVASSDGWTSCWRTRASPRRPPTLEMDEEVWDEMIEVNLTGQWKTIRAAVPHVIAGGKGGSVVITSSLAAIYANPNTAHYTAAKAGLVGFMKVLAKELAPNRIRVNTVHPTTVATDMILNEPTYRLFRPDLANPTRADFEVAARTLNKLPVAALEPADISNAILYLVSDAGRYVPASRTSWTRAASSAEKRAKRGARLSGERKERRN